MKINSITYKNSASIVVVDEQEYLIHNELIVTNHLKVDMDIENSVFKEIMEESDKKRCRDYLFSYLNKYLKTEKGYKEVLFAKKFSKKAVDFAINMALEYGYINDTTFCEHYLAKYAGKKGEYLLKQELKIKGVSEDIIAEKLTSLVDPFEALKEKKEKFFRNKEFDTANKQKFIRSLLSKGFSYDDINKVIDYEEE